MKGIQLKLKKEWVALPEDFSLRMEQTNPLFNEQGAFSFPFEVPLESNRHIFKNISDPFGEIRLEDIDGMESELWFNGVMLYRGLVEIDEEVEFEDSIPLTFLSGNGDFMKKIGELNAQDIPLDREIKLGYAVTCSLPTGTTSRDPELILPEQAMMNYINYNISNPYPASVYCNVRVCASNEFGRYKILGAKRPYSGVCFYAMYLFDLLFKYLNIKIESNNISDMEDMNRIAFFTTKCDNYLSKEDVSISLSEIRTDDFLGKDFTVIYHRNRTGRGPEVHLETESFNFRRRNVFATNKNFPNVLIKDIIEDFTNAFGVKILYDDKTNSVSLIYLKDIFNQKGNLTLKIPIFSVNVSKSKSANITLTYGVSDNTSFNYDDYSNVKEFEGYEKILQYGISYSNRTCAIDSITGNAYRVKVNKETGKDPSLFEVGGFRDYNSYPSKVSEENKELKINFSPVIVNDTTGGAKFQNAGYSSTGISDDTEQIFAVFANVELKKGDVYDVKTDVRLRDSRGGDGGSAGYNYVKVKCPELYDSESHDESPLRTYDAGYTLGIMRGAGSKSKVEYVEDYDEEGNASWVQTVANYAFTSDSCDNYGRFFDYNGTESGGTDQKGRFSLKLVVDKDDFPIDSQYANRGLVSKFLSEYLYFLENRKTVILQVEMNITQLIGIDFLRRYKIGDFVGFINKVSYNMTINGMEDVVIEMYTL